MSDDDDSIEVWVEEDEREGMDEDSAGDEKKEVKEEAVAEEVNHAVEEDVLGHEDGYGSTRLVLTKLGVVLAVVLKSAWYLFVGFSVWFTVRSAVCSMVEEDERRGCLLSFRDVLLKSWSDLKATWTPSVCLRCYVPEWQNQLGWLSGYNVRALKWTLPLGAPLMEFAKALLLISGVYWIRFLGVHTYRMDLSADADGEEEEETETGLGIRARVRRLAVHLKAESLDQRNEFGLYVLVVWLSANAFALLFTPLCLKVRLETSEDPFGGGVSWRSMAVSEYWGLFMTHIWFCSFVADIIFNVGPLLKIAPIDSDSPGEYGFVLYLALSVIGTACLDPLRCVLGWWWNGEVVA